MTADDETGNAQKISQFFQLQERFDEDPSIENYVALRRFAPRCDTEIYRFAGVDPLRSLESDLKKFGLDPMLVCGVLDGDDRETPVVGAIDRAEAIGGRGDDPIAKSLQGGFGRSHRSFDCCHVGSDATKRRGPQTLFRLACKRAARRRSLAQ
jgi:hypothetical protein